jgi:hypothetical protein
VKRVGLAAVGFVSLAACGSNGSERATPSVDVATSELVPWVAVESDGKNVTVYAGFRTGAGTSLKPVGLAGDDALAATIGGETVTLSTFAQFAGSQFKASPMLRDLSVGLGEGVYYAATVPAKSTEPVDVSVELRRAGTRGGPANVAKVRLASPQKITSAVPATVPLGSKLEVCWDTAPHVEPLPDIVNELGTFGLCTFGTTTFQTTGQGSPMACQDIDYSKVRLNDPAGCEMTLFSRATSYGTYTAPFRASPQATGDGGKPLPPDSAAPVAWQYVVASTKLGP